MLSDDASKNVRGSMASDRESTVDRVHLWRDDQGEYRFVPIGRNNEPLDNGSEGYEHEADARTAAKGLFGPDVRIVEDAG